MKPIRCLLGWHTTEPRYRGHWYPAWRCLRCGHDLRTPPPTTPEGGDR